MIEGLITRSNRDVLADTTTSDWLPNLKGRADVPEVIVETFRRVMLDLQATQAKLGDHAASIQSLDATVNNPPAQSVLTTFTELSVGSPGTPDGAVRIRVGRGTPEAIVEGSAFRDIWLRTDAVGITTCLYIKTSGEGKTGWTAAAI